MNHSATTSTHAAHVGTSRDGAPNGDTEAPGPEERDTAQPVAHDLVEPGASHRLSSPSHLISPGAASSLIIVSVR